MNKILKFKINKDNNFFLIFSFFYLFSILCFFFNIDPNGGAYLDYLNQKRISQEFAENFFFKFYSFDQESTRHSPVLLIILSFFEKIKLSDIYIRLITFHFCLILPLLFYKLLKIKFYFLKNKELLLLSCLIFFSPTFLSLSIWPDSRIYGVIFFTLSLINFIKFEQKRNLINVYKCIFWYALSSYFSLNFALLSIFFVIKFLSFYKFDKKIIFIIGLNLILALPAFIYTLSLESVFFLKSGISGKEFDIKDSLNFSNKIILISSVVFFYLIPFYTSNIVNLNFLKIKDLSLGILIFLICLNFFNYDPSYSGGGIFFKLSHFIFGNNFLIFLISIFSITAIINFTKLNIYNGLIIALLIISNVQFSIYHKYYDPLLFILFFSIFDMNLDKIKIKKIKFLHFYLFFIFFLILNFLKQSI